VNPERRAMLLVVHWFDVVFPKQLEPAGHAQAADSHLLKLTDRALLATPRKKGKEESIARAKEIELWIEYAPSAFNQKTNNIF